MRLYHPVCLSFIGSLCLVPAEVSAQQDTTGFFNTAYLSFAAGSNDAGELILGAGLHAIIGYRWRPAFGAGLGLGVDNYARSGETLYPVFVELRHYLPAGKQHRFYLVLSTGYGFAFHPKDSNITESKGGWMVHPCAGFRSFSKDGTNIHFDLGVKFQRAEFTREQPNGDIEFRSIQYRRIALRVGVTLR